MSTPIRIWLHGTTHAAFRCGGWAYVRAVGDQVTGRAGGDRATTPFRMALTGLIAACGDLPAGADPIEVHGGADNFDDIEELREAAELDPINVAEEIALWERFGAAIAGRSCDFRPATKAPGTPMAFVVAWAELGRDKAKATGRFNAAIPKPNLAKIAGLSGPPA